jgi:hypothetical protein
LIRTQLKTHHSTTNLPSTMGEPTDGSHMGKDDHTAALLEKLTQMITLQQTQILNLQQNTNSSLSIPTAESYIHPNPISVKLNGKN